MAAMDASKYPELGFYTLAGAPQSPRELLDEVRDAETQGLGRVFISERFNIKEASTLSGAVGAVSNRIALSTAATNHNTRHPIVTASYATTMHRLTNGRFTLGIGRGIDPLFDAFGIPRITTAQMEDFAGLMRRLWKGETVLSATTARSARFRCFVSIRPSTKKSRSASWPSDRTHSNSAAGPSTKWCCTRSSPDENAPAVRRHREGGGREGGA